MTKIFSGLVRLVLCMAFFEKALYIIFDTIPISSNIAMLGFVRKPLDGVC